MKLVIATPLYPPEIGGPATYADTLMKGLPKHGIEVALVKFSEVRHLPKVLRHYVYYRRVLRAARSADVVLALDPVSVGYPSMMAARKAGKKFIVKIVGDYAWEQGRQRFGVSQSLDEFVRIKQVSFMVRFLQRIQTLVTLSATKIIVPSEYLKNIVMAWGIQSDKIEVIHNAVQLESIGNVPDSIDKLARPLIVTAGRLVPWKHIDKVIDAVAVLSSGSLVIIGDGPERTTLIERGRQKLGERVNFTGALSHRDTLAVLSRADVFVLNSSYEGLSHFLIEAQMLGVPTVATSVGGNPEVITDHEDGLLIPPSLDTSALIEAISRVLGDETLRANLRKGALNSSRRFSPETMVRTIARLISTI